MNQVEQNYEKLNTYSQQIIPALDDYKKSYIFYHRTPENQEYANLFSIDSGNITTLNKNLFITSNDIQSHLDDLNIKITNLDKKIIVEKKHNNILVFKLQQIEGTGNGALIMNSNSKETYKTQYIANWNMFIGVCILIGMLITIFKKNKILSIPGIPGIPGIPTINKV